MEIIKIVILKIVIGIIRFNSYLTVKFSFVLLKLYSKRKESFKAIVIFENLLKKYNKKFSAGEYLFISKIYRVITEYRKADYYNNKYLEAQKDRLEKNKYYLSLQYSWAMFARAYRMHFLEDKQIERNIKHAPSWFNVSSLYMTSSLDKNKKNAGFFMRLTHSHLFYAHELKMKGDFTGAISIIKNILTAIGGVLSDNFIINIIKTIENNISEVRPEHSLQDELIEQVKHCEAGYLSSMAWLNIYNILIFNGLLLSGLAARNMAIKQAYYDADLNNTNKKKVKRAILAALDRKDFLKAENYINQYKAISGKNSAAKMEAYFNLLTGDIQKARRLWTNNFTQADFSFADYFDDKTVAIVGPAPNGINSGMEIDSFDIVIRFNYMGAQSSCNVMEFGTKTNVSLYASNFMKFSLREYQTFLEDLDFYIVKYKFPEFVLADLDKGRAKLLIKNNYMFYKKPNALQCVLFDILHYKPKKIKVFKSNFFLSETPYATNYRGLDFNNTKSKLPDPLTLFVYHDLISQLSFVHCLWKQGLIEVDKNCEEILKLSEEEYMQGMGKLV